MRGRAVILAGLLSLGACASLGTVDKTPDPETVAAILVKALECRDVPGGEPCKPAEQPREVRLAGLDCVSLPLRSAFRESAHARCAWSGEIIRVDGSRAPLTALAGDFSLVDLTPGAYRPTREWTLGKLE